MNRVQSTSERIIKDMREALMVIKFGGTIVMVNPAALKIFEKDENELVGKSFASCFFEYRENDDFNEVILKAVSDQYQEHADVVPFRTASGLKMLAVRSRFLDGEGSDVGIMVLISDVTNEHRILDGLERTTQIKELNNQLELQNALLAKLFGKYLSEDIVTEIINTKGFERKTGEATVLIANMKNISHIIGLIGFSEAGSFISTYFEEMVNTIEKNGGTVLELTMGQMLAVFGAPSSVKDKEKTAVLTALEMKRIFDGLSKTFTDVSEDKKPYLKIAIHSGEVVMGSLGSEEHSRYAIIGKTVNYCGRMMQHCGKNEVVISKTTKKQIKEKLIISKESEVMSKGIKTPKKIFTVIGLSEEK